MIKDTNIARLNIGSQVNSKTGVKGVSERYNKYVATITFRKNLFHLGYFDTLEDAKKFREEAEKILFHEFLELYAQGIEPPPLPTPVELREMIAERLKYKEKKSWING